MKTEHLIILAAVAAAGYFLWYKPKRDAERASQEVAIEMVQKGGQTIAASLGMPLLQWAPQTADTVAV